MAQDRHSTEEHVEQFENYTLQRSQEELVSFWIVDCVGHEPEVTHVKSGVM